MEPETPATESGGDGPARQPAKEVDRTKLSAVVFKHLKLEQDEGESLLEFAARYAARGAARALHERSRARLSRVRRVSCSIAPNPLPPPEGAVIKFVEDGRLGPDTLSKTLLPAMGQRARVKTGARVARALTLAREHERRMRPAGGALVGCHPLMLIDAYSSTVAFVYVCL